MVYKDDIGFSNIRIPNEKADLLYTYTISNSFPEEVYIHEFIHNLERIENEYENDIPELHSYENYGYSPNEPDGLKRWYTDYMKGTINNTQTGLSKKVYTIKPVHNSCFTNSIDLTREKFYEPKNLIEDIQRLIEKIKEYLNIGTEGENDESRRV